MTGVALLTVLLHDMQMIIAATEKGEIHNDRKNHTEQNHNQTTSA
jgi:hypothetical protein